MPPAVVGPAKVVSSSLPSTSHPLGMHNSIAHCTDFPLAFSVSCPHVFAAYVHHRWRQRSPSRCLPRSIWESWGIWRARCRPSPGIPLLAPGASGLALPHIAQCPPCARASVLCGSGWVVSAPWGLRALGYVRPVLFWSAALRGPAVPIPLAYLALCTLPQWKTFLKVTCADGRPM